MTEGELKRVKANVTVRYLTRYRSPCCETLIETSVQLPPFKDECPECDKPFLVEASDE